MFNEWFNASFAQPITVHFGSVIILVIGLGTIGYITWLKGGKNYPPGPRGLPFFGVQLSDTAWNDFEEWGKKYGDIMYMEASGQKILVLNSRAAAVNLLDRRGGNYNNRQEFVVINEFLTRGLLLASTNDDDLWRKMRRAGHEVMNKTATTKYHRIQEREALVFIENLLQDSKEWYQEAYRTTISGLQTALYDVPPIVSRTDPLIKKINDFDKFLVHAGYPGNYLVESITWMKYFPAAISPWKRRAEAWFAEFSDFYMRLLRDVESRLDEGNEKLGMVAHTIRQQTRLGLSDVEAAWVPAGFSNGGMANAETLAWFFLAMIAYPDKQRKCQEELDTVVGRSRMPTFDDRDNLPYLRATVRELIRWRPNAPLSIPHDDIYEGYFIPKGTAVFPHIWLMNRDPNIYGQDAEDFNPDRFIDEQGGLIPAIADTKDVRFDLIAEGHVSYGFGLRLCPGRHYANDTLFITFARLLWAATISPPINKQTGKPVIPDLLATVGITIRPPPFDCVVKARFSDAAEMVARTKELST
ncbi:hypothetical protein CVT25_010543 [Psilocybe cyanescens]|uniref:Cytochrome P450 n=1 Tax=Psilocybe cyanescens TaxID=93625 RepID=A0A409WJE8_PSICY|nr:hypothetical protein CVT25_010543 [Psilocybe cyanescens]